MLLKSIKMFSFMVKQITKEAMMILLLLAPFFAGMLFKFGIPFAEHFLCEYFHLAQCISPYYDVFDWLLALLIGMLFAFTGGLMTLGEMDDRITLYYCVTPGGRLGYILSRIVYPAVLSGIASLILLPCFSIGRLSVFSLLLMVVSTVLSGIVTVLLVIAISTNKVEGMAIGKLSGGFGITMLLPLVIHGKIAILFSPFPMFWIGEYYFINQTPVFLGIALLLFMVWIIGLYKVFTKKIG